jgi:hypothetical protein
MVHHNTHDPSKVIDVAFEKESSFEERCWFFFRRYSKYWTYAFCFLIGIGLLVAITLWVKELYGQHVRNRFTALQTPEDKIAFAESYTSHPLAGICFLESADAAYQAKDYSSSAKYYEQAQAGLKHTVFGGRAALGKAMSLLANSDKEEGRIALLSTATDMHYPQSIRAEAFYLSAVLNLDRGKPHKAKRLLQYLVDGDYGEIWKGQAEDLAKNYHLEF